MKKLFLGLDFGRTISERLEFEFSDIEFGILACWTNLRKNEIVEEQIKELKFIKDNSIHITPPQLDIRFNQTKYDKAETFYIKEYLSFARLEFNNSKHKILKQILPFKEILILCSLSTNEAIIWLSDLVSLLKENNVTMKILATFPAHFEGEYRLKSARQICEQLINSDIELHVLFLDDMHNHYGNILLLEFDNIMWKVLEDAANNILLNQNVNSKFITSF